MVRVAAISPKSCLSDKNIERMKTRLLLSILAAGIGLPGGLEGRDVMTLSISSRLPACFAALPEEDIVDIPAAATIGRGFVEDPEAATGIAYEDVRIPVASKMKYEIGSGSSERGGCLSGRAISAADVVPDAYHFYHAGRFEVIRSSFLWMNRSCMTRAGLGEVWNSRGGGLWDAYVSMKLEGKFFSERSKAKRSRVLVDRIVLVRVPGDEAAQPEELPAGEGLPALPPDPFPDRMSAFVWRNWGIVSKTRLAETVGALPSELTTMAVEMGLPADPPVEPEWETHGYITIIRRNWHLLDYNQLLKLTGMSWQRMRAVLLEHDFLFQKLGRMKPLCRPLLYRSNESALTCGARMKIAEMLSADGVDAAASHEPRFSFINELCSPTTDENADSPLRSPGLRLMSSYFADFEDPLGSDDVSSYPDGILSRLAAEGINAIWLPVAFSRMDAAHFANARILTARAARHGMGVYVYLNEPRGDGEAVCTSLPESRRRIADKARELFSAVPDLRGAITITASENLTSCASHGGKDHCSRCKNRSFADIVAEVNGCIAEGMHAANPNAELIVWDWGWDSVSGEDWRTLVPSVLEKLPNRNVRYLTVSERFVNTLRGGFHAKVNEYSISTPGPGERAVECWRIARKRGIGAIAKVQASASWEFASIPYLPCMDLVAEHAWNLSQAGINDVMLSWSVGAWPSPNLKLFGLVKPEDSSPNAALGRLAASLYGAANSASACAAWKAYSAGFREYPFWSCVIHRGPHHMGPANPLYLTNTGYRATMTGIPYDDLAGWRDIYPEETWISQMAKVRDGFTAGNRLWAAHLERLSGPTREFAEREYGMFRAAELHFSSVVAQSEFIRSRRRKDVAGMRKQAELELKTAKGLLKLVLADSRIGYECANHYFYTPQDLREKIVNCRKIIQSLSVCNAEPKDVPELMRLPNGDKVDSLAVWEDIRRPEILDCFSKRMFGRRPASAEHPDMISFELLRNDAYPEAGATRKVVRVNYRGPCGDGHFDITVFIPASEKPVPAFLLICNRKDDNIDPDRKIRNGFWPVEKILSRGYAAVSFTTHSVATDKNVGFDQGVFQAFQKPQDRDDESWAAISAWAWGASRVMDWIETAPEIDASKVAVVGHSRGGKAALWTGATDRRFAFVCSNNSGCGGAKLNHIELPESEHIIQILKSFSYWFCGKYAQAAGKEFELDFDQHWLISLIAPRLVAVGSATADDWAGQRGEFYGALLASPAWELYGASGLAAREFPPPDVPLQEGCISYHIKTGEHSLTEYDWKCYMDFAGRHGWGDSARTSFPASCPELNASSGSKRKFIR